MEHLGAEAEARAAAAEEAIVVSNTADYNKDYVWAFTRPVVAKIVRALKRAMQEEDGEWFLFQV
jgi:hypothetical protein